MAEDFGSGVSRTLSALQRQFELVVWQKGRPPLDSELNLVGQIALERMRNVVRSNMHSGFLTDPTAALEDFETDPSWSNFFKLGKQESGEDAPILWANVNGMLIPVTGTNVLDGDTSNQINLFPPPTSDARTDFVFLEAWVAQVAPNPSETNKPATDKVYKHGNTEFSGTNLDDDIEDPTIGFETTERLQVQYRLRVFGSGEGLGTSIGIDDYPDGLGDPNVLGQGTSTSPVTGFAFSNMRGELRDPSLWRAGDGDPDNDLGTHDGYTYAIPVAAIFRRNSSVFRAREAAGNANQNGAFNRTPSTASLANPQEGAAVLATATTSAYIDETTVGSITVSNLTGSGFDDTSHTNLFMVLDDEIIEVSAVDAAGGTVTIPAGGRGRYGTAALPHEAGTELKFFNSNPDGLFADEIALTDILDLRRSVTMGEWDYDQLLSHNLSKLLRGELRSTWKQSNPGDTAGPVVTEVDTLLADGATSVPNQTEALDGPDGIRTIFSDAATIQPDVTVMIDADLAAAGGFVSSFTTGVNWDVAADFAPSGFVTGNSFSNGLANNSTVFLHIGGAGSGNAGARSTFRDGSERAVRFVTPREFWLSDSPESTTGLQHPVKLNFLDEPALNFEAGSETATEHPGPLYPLKASNFEKPYIFLGGVLHPDFNVTSVEVFNDSPGVGEYEVSLPGLDFDTAGDWFSKTGGAFDNDPTAINKPVLNSSRTLYDMMTAGGTDRTGASSELYLVLFGDDSDILNNGVFKIIGAGATAGYTFNDASAADRVRVSFIRPLSVADGFAPPAAAGLQAQVRSQYTNAEDGSGTAGIASACIVFTDIEGETGGAVNNPWNATNLGALALPASNAGDPGLGGKGIFRLTLQYHPGRSAMARVPDQIHRLAVVSAGSEYLRQSPTGTDRDGSFASESGVADSETYFDVNSHIGTWNRLSSLGLDGKEAPAHGGAIVAFNEQDREAEAFFDTGSKTLLFRPYQNKLMTMQQTTLTSGTLIPSSYPAGHGGFTVDGATLFDPALNIGYAVPWEYMPRFGRQDIPYKLGNNGQFLEGINHLFTDDSDNTDAVFNIIGGEAGAAATTGVFVQTGVTSGLTYGEYGTITGTGEDGYQGRLLLDNTVQSSDLGRGMKGIQLPPFLGVARLYGVYDLRDFQSKGGDTFEADRTTPVADPPANLLRNDAAKQTLFIVQGGAEDATENANDHTYVIPENAIDIRLSDSYVAGEVFEDLEYVVEIAGFGFARGWINQNNFVLARNLNGENNPAEATLDPIGMTIPAAAPRPDQTYVMYSRTPYQGDPYQTRAGSTQTTSDYENRYGQVPQDSAVLLGSSIQQFDADGNVLIQTPNLRSLQVLSSLEFYTTLGTGNIGGDLFPGTVTDVGNVAADGVSYTRVPADTGAPRWLVTPRAFTAGQAGNTNRAFVNLAIIDNASVGGSRVSIERPDGTNINIDEPGDYSAGADAVETATNLAAEINSRTSLIPYVKAYSDGTSVVRIEAVAPGLDGEKVRVLINTPDAMELRVPQGALTSTDQQLTAVALQGGRNAPVNGGSGSSSLSLTGMTERLPLGILLQDCDFLGEDPLSNRVSAMVPSPAGVRPVQQSLPLSDGLEYTRLLGGAGNWIGMADGSILEYAPYSEISGTGSRKFRLYRGASAFVLSDPRPGGPIDWAAGDLDAGLEPVLKGGVLAVKAMLVRNFHEEPFTPSRTVSDGDEIQMVVMTRGMLSQGNTVQEGMAITGLLSPTGYGEGYAAADRYRLEGKPMVRGATRKPKDPNVDLALFPFDDPILINTEC